MAAPFQQAGRGISELASNPLALLGGTLGMGLSIAVMVLLFLAWERNAEAHDAEIDFEAGALMRLGQADAPEGLVLITDMMPIDDALTALPQPEPIPDEAPAPEPIPETTPEPAPETPPVVESTTPAPSTDVTTSPEPAPIEAPAPEPEPKPEPKPRPKPKPKPEPETKPAPKPEPVVVQPSKPALPTPPVQGDPFGDPGGWDDLRKSGDAWATSVIKKLNTLQYPAWAGENQQGTFKFRLQVCKDGSVGTVLIKGSTGDSRLDNAMKNEVSRTKFARPPAEITSAMGSQCAFLKHDFSWSASGRVR